MPRTRPLRPTRMVLTMTEVWIRANGTPIPQGSKSAKVVNGRALMWDANPALKAWRENVAQAAWRAVDQRQSSANGNEALAVTVWLYLPKPKTVKRDRPSVKPDIDKLCRAILDGLTDGGAWSDDAQVVELSAAKLYADEHTKPGAMIHIRSI